MPFNEIKEQQIVRYSGYLNHDQAKKLDKYVEKTGISKAKVLGQLLDLLEEDLPLNSPDTYVTSTEFKEELSQLKMFIVEKFKGVQTATNKELSKVNNFSEIEPPEEFVRLPIGEVTVKELALTLKCDRNLFAAIAKRERATLPFNTFWEYLQVKPITKGNRALFQWIKIK